MYQNFILLKRCSFLLELEYKNKLFFNLKFVKILHNWIIDPKTVIKVETPILNKSPDKF